jgi:WD40 repeat protein
MGEVMLWDVSSPESPSVFLPHGSPVTSAVYGPDGRTLLTATEDGEVRLWDLGRADKPFGPKLPGKGAVGTSIQTCFSMEQGGHQYFNPGIAFSLKRVSGPQEVHWPDEEAVKRLLPPGTLFQSVALSPDRTRVLTGHVDPKTPSDAKESSLQLWDAQARRRLGHPLQMNRRFNYAAFSPDSRFVVAAVRDGTARLVDARTGEPVGGPLEHGAEVLSVAFSPDSALLVTCGADNTARLWHTQTGRPARDSAMRARSSLRPSRPTGEWWPLPPWMAPSVSGMIAGTLQGSRIPCGEEIRRGGRIGRGFVT